MSGRRRLICLECAAGIAITSACLAAGPSRVVYEQRWEGAVPQPLLKTDSQNHVVRFSGPTQQRRASGQWSYKIDIQFQDGTYCDLIFPIEQPIALTRDLRVQAGLLLEEGGPVGLGCRFAVDLARPAAQEVVHRRRHFKSVSQAGAQWQQVSLPPGEFRALGERVCGEVLRDPDVVGIGDQDLPIYFEIADPICDGWYVHLRFKPGQRVVVYVDDVLVTSTQPAEQVAAAAPSRQDRFGARRDHSVDYLSRQIEAAQRLGDRIEPRLFPRDVPALERRRNSMAMAIQQRATWPPQDLNQWLTALVAVRRFHRQIEQLEIRPIQPVLPRREAGVSVVAVKPFPALGDLPDPSTFPKASVRLEQLKMEVCAGELTHGSLCVYAGAEPLKNVSIRFTDLTAEVQSDHTAADLYCRPLAEPWKFAADPTGRGRSGEWFRPGFDDSNWAEMRTDLGKGWEQQGFEDQKVGWGWYRQTLQPEQRAADHARRYLYFRAVDEQALVYLNGRLIFEHTVESTGLATKDLWDKPFAVDVTDIWSGRAPAHLTVGVHNQGDQGGIWRPVYLAAGGAKLDVQQISRHVLDRQERSTPTRVGRLPGQVFDPYIVKWWWRKTTDTDPQVPRWRGELLVRDSDLIRNDHDQQQSVPRARPQDMRDADQLQPVDLDAGHGVQYLLATRVDVGALPGRYRGRVQVTDQHSVLAELPVEVRVLPFTLAKPLLDYRIYYRGGNLTVKQPRAVDSDYKTDEQLAGDIADILDHGFAGVLWYCPAERVLTMRSRFNLTGPVWVMYPGTNVPQEFGYQRWGEHVITQLRARGCSEVYVAAMDEPGLAQMSEAQLRIDTAHRFWGTKAFTALASPGSWEQLRHYLDLPILARSKLGWRSAVAQWQSVGKRVYSYGAPRHDTAGVRWYYGLQAWKDGCHGVAHYAYQDPIGGRWDPGQDDYCNMTWPTVNGRVATLDFEALRQAIYDVRFVSTLVEWLGRTAGPLAGHPARAAADKCLASIDPHGDLDVQRAQIIDHILSLRAAMGAGGAFE